MLAMLYLESFMNHLYFINMCKLLFIIKQNNYDVFYINYRFVVNDTLCSSQ